MKNVRDTQVQPTHWVLKKSRTLSHTHIMRAYARPFSSQLFSSFPYERSFEGKRARHAERQACNRMLLVYVGTVEEDDRSRKTCPAVSTLDRHIISLFYTRRYTYMRRCIWPPYSFWFYNFNRLIYDLWRKVFFCTYVWLLSFFLSDHAIVSKSLKKPPINVCSGA